MKHKLLLGLLCGLIFTIPSNLFLKFFESRAYANGIFVDYLIPKIYLSDLLIAPLLVMWTADILKDKKNWFIILKNKKVWLLIGLILLLLIKQLLTTRTVAALWYTAKLMEMGLVLTMLWQHKKMLLEKAILYTIIATILFQSSIGLLQFRNQRSVGGYWLLGETNISATYGLATTNMGGEVKVSAYGTTAHPNILAGILATYLLAVIFAFPAHTKSVAMIKIFTLAVGLTALVDTGSLSGLAMLAVGLVVLSQKITPHKLLMVCTICFLGAPLVLAVLDKHFSESLSITRRASLNWRALTIFKDHPLLGIGLNQFTTAPFSSSFKELTRFVQPVHHVGLLWLAETGLVGLVALMALVRKIKWQTFAIPFAILLPSLALDHYLLTQQSGLLLGIFTLVYFSR